MIGKVLEWYFRYVQFNPHPLFMRSRLKAIASGVLGRVLDIGAGDAPYRSMFMNAKEYITTNTRRYYSGTDFERIDKLTDYWIDDGSLLPVPDHDFDCVCMFQVLSVIANPEAMFRELQRVVASSGIILISTDFVYPSWSSEDHMHHTAPGLHALASNNGFIVKEIQGFGGIGSTLYMIIQNYLRSYPEKATSQSAATRISATVLLPFIMLSSAILSVFGFLTYRCERNIKRNHKYSYNLLLIAQKLVPSS